MENKSTTKDFLQLCYKQVVDPALENGLDEECYYHFLSEMYRALTCDSGVRRKYHKMLDEAWEDMIAKFNPDSDKIWVSCYEVIFQRQFYFMIELGSFACASVVDEATYGLARGILNFIQLQLRYQKRFLDGVGMNTPVENGDDPKFRQYFLAMNNYDHAKDYAKGLDIHLSEIEY